jgi:glycosyltransferase involved in cell wall biosynthesis
MKILYVCKSLPHSYQGGIQTHVWKLSEWVVKLGHDVSILTAGSWTKGERRYEMGGREIIEVPYLPGRRLPALSLAAEEMSFNLAAKKWLLDNQSNYDIIHLQGRSGNLFLKNKAHIKVPVVNTLHGLVEIEQNKSKDNKLDSLDARLHRTLAGNMENTALKNADALIAVSNEMMGELAARMPEALCKTTKIYNGVDVPPMLRLGDTDPNLLLFVGRLTAIKGVFELVEAMRFIPEPIRLVMIGDGEAKQELIERIQRYGLEHRIRLLGGLSMELVEKWLHRCHALVLPSFHETQGIVLMEANACGKPVIANGVGGVPEVVQNGENGLLMPSNKPEVIAGMVEYLFKHRDRAVKMGLIGRQIVQEKFAWKGIAEQTLSLYRLLAKGSFRLLTSQLLMGGVHSN